MNALDITLEELGVVKQTLQRRDRRWRCTLYAAMHGRHWVAEGDWKVEASRALASAAEKLQTEQKAVSSCAT